MDELARARTDNPAWRVWCGEPFLYATRLSVLSPGQGCTVFGRDAAELAAEIARTEAHGAARAAKRERLAGHGW